MEICSSTKEACKVNTVTYFTDYSLVKLQFVLENASFLGHAISKSNQCDMDRRRWHSIYLAKTDHQIQTDNWQSVDEKDLLSCFCSNGIHIAMGTWWRMLPSSVGSRLLPYFNCNLTQCHLILFHVSPVHWQRYNKIKCFTALKLASYQYAAIVTYWYASHLSLIWQKHRAMLITWRQLPGRGLDVHI